MKWSVFITTFLTIFVAELGDKTQLAVLLMSAKTGAKWTVLIASVVALVLTSILGVCAGGWLGSKLSPQTLQYAAGAGFVVIGILLLFKWI